METLEIDILFPNVRKKSDWNTNALLAIAYNSYNIRLTYIILENIIIYSKKL